MHFCWIRKKIDFTYLKRLKRRRLEEACSENIVCRKIWLCALGYVEKNEIRADLNFENYWKLLGVTGDTDLKIKFVCHCGTLQSLTSIRLNPAKSFEMVKKNMQFSTLCHPSTFFKNFNLFHAFPHIQEHRAKSFYIKCFLNIT